MPTAPPLTLQSEADTNDLIDYLFQPLNESDTSTNRNIFRLDAPLEASFHTAHAPKGYLLRHDMMLRAMLRPPTYDLFRRYTIDSDEFKHIATFLNYKSTPASGASLPLKQIQDLFLTLSCLYLFIRLNIPKGSSPTLIATVRAKFLDIRNPETIPLAKCVSDRLDAIRAVHNKKGLAWSEYSRKLQADCLCRALTTHIAVSPPPATWLLTLAHILETDPKKQFPYIDIDPNTDRTVRDPSDPDTPPNPHLHFPDLAHIPPIPLRHTPASQNLLATRNTPPPSLTPTPLNAQLLPAQPTQPATLTQPTTHPNLVYTRAGYTIPHHRPAITHTLALLKTALTNQSLLIQRVRASHLSQATRRKTRQTLNCTT